LKRSTRGEDGDGDLAMEDNDLGGFREFWKGVVCGRFVDDWGQDRTELCEKAEY